MLNTKRLRGRDVELQRPLVEFLYKKEISFLLKKQLSLVSQQIINKKVLVNILPNRNLPNQNTEEKRRTKSNKQTTSNPRTWLGYRTILCPSSGKPSKKHSKGQRTLPSSLTKSLPCVPKDGNIAT
jgi:hypothetical protein